MKPRLHRLARRFWAGELGWGGSALGLALWPLEILWRTVTAIRNRRFDRGATVRIEGLAVVSVGNLAVGGTGKTPVTSWVVRTLERLEARPAVLLSGYGLDEVDLHRSWTPTVPVIATRDRVEAARRAGRAGANVAVLDDGFQHRRLGRDLDIVLLAVEDRVPGACLPRGPYREPIDALRRADVLVLTRRSATVEQAHELARKLADLHIASSDAVTACARLAARTIRPLVGTQSDVARAPLVNPLVMTAVARPEKFGHDVEALVGAPVEVFAFADHHRFTLRDARRARARAGSRPIVVTEKDAVKLVELADVLGDVQVVEQRVVWDWGEAEVRARLHGIAERVRGAP